MALRAPANRPFTSSKDISVKPFTAKTAWCALVHTAPLQRFSLQGGQRGAGGVNGNCAASSNLFRICQHQTISIHELGTKDGVEQNTPWPLRSRSTFAIIYDMMIILWFGNSHQIHLLTKTLHIWCMAVGHGAGRPWLTTENEQIQRRSTYQR